MGIGKVALSVALFTGAMTGTSARAGQVETTPPSAAGHDPSQDDIVVLARKLKNWRGVVKTVRGETVCKTKRTSGDQVFDANMCSMLTYCVVQTRNELNMAEKMPRAERSAQYQSANAKIGDCLRAKTIEKGYATAG